MKIGSKVKVFDGMDWSKTGDVGDNSDFYKPATVIKITPDPFHIALVDVIFDYKPDQISRGHFIGGINEN